jgi:polysaccharide export outer membrane protein
MIMKSIPLYITVVLSILFFSGCGRDRTMMKTDQPIRIKLKGKLYYDYIIKPHDRVSVIAYKYPELTPTSMSEKGILVDADGYVSLPLVHRVKIAGLTQTKASKLLEKRYAKFLKDPSLNLEVLNKRAYILGEVKKPGVVPLDRETSNIFEAIAIGEGLTDDALRDSVMVLTHNYDGEPELRRVDLSNYHTLSMSNINIKPDDVIYIPPSAWKEFRVAADNFSVIFQEISKIASPFVTLKYLSD